MWDKIDLSLLSGLIAAIVGLFGVIAYVIKNNNRTKNNNQTKVMSMLEKQVDYLQKENLEQRQRIDALQKQVIDLYKSIQKESINN